eukprot:NODE_447_length_8464_cov_0.381112.p4 type:complete len:296 gc:universal NODE_447_length_8464_cov_0.381112:4271-3384(-)
MNIDQVENEAYDLYLKVQLMIKANAENSIMMDVLRKENHDLKAKIVEQDKMIASIERYKIVCSKLKSLNSKLVRIIPIESQSKFRKTLEWMTQPENEEKLDVASVSSNYKPKKIFLTDQSGTNNVKFLPSEVENENDLNKQLDDEEDSKLSRTQHAESCSDDEIEIIGNIPSATPKPTLFSTLLEGSKKVNWKEIEQLMEEKEKESSTSACKRKSDSTRKYFSKKKKGGIKINETKRNKEERKKQYAHQDGCCDSYYKEFGNQNQVKDISRHRSNYQEPSTPPGFWETTFPPSQN